MEVVFNELNITRDSKTLSIDVTVNNDTGEDYIISRVAVDTCATFNEMLGRPSSYPILDFENASQNFRKVYTDDHIFQNKILFVWIECTDDTEVVYRLAAVVNWYTVYCKAMCFVKKIDCHNCTPPLGFVDFILKVKGLEYALQTGNYTQAVRIWKAMYTKGEASNLKAGDCGCGC